MLNNQTPKIYIGLPVYNGEEFIENAIVSILDQTYSNFQLLISDNASTDETGSIALRYAESDSRISYYRHDHNMGAAPNFNYCVERAEGKYFKWMAHDDRLDSDYLRQCITLLESDTGAVLCHAGVVSIDDEGNVKGSYEKERNFNDPSPVLRFRRAMALGHACVSVFGVMRLDVLRQTQRIAPFVGSDRSLLADLALHGRIEYVTAPLFFWRLHKNRSVRMLRRDRVTWFDTNANPILSILYLRQLLAAQRISISSRQPFPIKCRALLETVKWAFTNWKLFYRDLRSVGGILFRNFTRQSNL